MKLLINVFKVSSTILEKQGLTDPITDTQAGLSPRVRLWIVYVVVVVFFFYWLSVDSRVFGVAGLDFFFQLVSGR